MSYTKFAPVNEVSRLRRFQETLRLDPAKATIFYVVIGLLIAVAMFGGAYALMHGIDNARVVADIKDAPLLTTTATVQGKEPWDLSTKTNPGNSGVVLVVGIGGRSPHTSIKLDERTFAVKIGDKIQVKYRVGKSGAIYIDYWQPLLR